MAKPTIVLIDDDKFMRKFLALALGKLGYEVREADTGEAGLALLASTLPAAVICDQIMPGLQGTDVLSRLRALPAHKTTPFVLLSGDDVTLPADSLVRGMKKPVDAKQLEQILAALIGMKKAA